MFDAIRKSPYPSTALSEPTEDHSVAHVQGQNFLFDVAMHP